MVKPAADASIRKLSLMSTGIKSTASASTVVQEAATPSMHSSALVMEFSSSGNAKATTEQTSKSGECQQATLSQP